MGEIRKKLTARQLAAYQVARAAVQAGQATLNAAQEKICQWADLVFDANGLPPDTAARVDEVTGELIIASPDALPDVPGSPEAKPSVAH